MSDDDLLVKRRQKDHWHVGKEIPLALVCALFLQSAAGIWWAATTTAELRAMKDQLESVARHQVTGLESRGLIQLNSAGNIEQNRRIAELESRVRELEQLQRKRP
jgi:hypothetical protein